MRLRNRHANLDTSPLKEKAKQEYFPVLIPEHPESINQPALFQVTLKHYAHDIPFLKSSPSKLENKKLTHSTLTSLPSDPKKSVMRFLTGQDLNEMLKVDKDFHRVISKTPNLHAKHLLWQSIEGIRNYSSKKEKKISRQIDDIGWDAAACWEPDEDTRILIRIMLLMNCGSNILAYFNSATLAPLLQKSSAEVKRDSVTMCCCVSLMILSPLFYKPIMDTYHRCQKEALKKELNNVAKECEEKKAKLKSLFTYFHDQNKLSEIEKENNRNGLKKMK